METVTTEAPPSWALVQRPPLGAITSPTIDTEAAAYYLNRKPQTLRMWACKKTGPIKPTRVYGRLAWSVAEIKRVLEGA